MVMKKLLLLFAILLCTTCQKEADYDLLSDTDQQEIIAKKIKKPTKKVDVCHGGRIINISENAVRAHLKHGDAIDMDGDGYFNKENECSEGIDCNDDDATINPGTSEICADEVDNNCNGLVDCNDEECNEDEACLCGVNCPPVAIVINELKLNLTQTGSTTISADLFDAGSFDACGCPLTFSFSEDQNDQYRTLFCEDPVELQFIIWVTNPAGNQGFAQTNIYIEDNREICEGNLTECIPLAVVQSDYSTVLPSSSQITINAAELIWYSEDICGTGNLTYTIKKQDDPGAPSESIILNCDDVGINLLELWVNDGFNSAMVTTTINLQDYEKNCE